MNSNLQASLGEVHRAQTTVEGTEAGMGTKRKWLHLNGVKPAAWPSRGTGPQPGQEARQHSREGRCQPLVTPAPPCHLCSCFCHSLGVFPNCQPARVLQGKAWAGDEDSKSTAAPTPNRLVLLQGRWGH